MKVTVRVVAGACLLGGLVAAGSAGAGESVQLDRVRMPAVLASGLTNPEAPRAPEADLILHWLLRGYSPARLVDRGFDAAHVDTVWRRLSGTHWKRRLPTVAMLSGQRSRTSKIIGT